MSDGAAYVLLMALLSVAFMCGWITGYRDGQSSAEDK